MTKLSHNDRLLLGIAEPGAMSSNMIESVFDRVWNADEGPAGVAALNALTHSGLVIATGGELSLTEAGDAARDTAWQKLLSRSPWIRSLR